MTSGAGEKSLAQDLAGSLKVDEEKMPKRTFISRKR